MKNVSTTFVSMDNRRSAGPLRTIYTVPKTVQGCYGCYKGVTKTLKQCSTSEKPKSPSCSNRIQMYKNRTLGQMKNLSSQSSDECYSKKKNKYFLSVATLAACYFKVSNYYF